MNYIALKIIPKMGFKTRTAHTLPTHTSIHYMITQQKMSCIACLVLETIHAMVSLLCVVMLIIVTSMVERCNGEA